jgi:hypothetical protein
VAGGLGGDAGPHLTRGDRLLGTGAFAQSPAQDLEYRRGYLCGMLRGYASAQPRPHKRGRRLNREPAALIPCGVEAWERAGRWLREWRLETHSVLPAMASGGTHSAQVVRAHTVRAGHEEFQDAIRWPERASISWSTGFLAGIFDTASSCDAEFLRICHPDPAVIGRIGEALRLLNIARRLDIVRQAGRPAIAAVRVLGGLAGQLRFIHSCDPAVTARRDISEQPVTSGTRLGVAAIEPLRVGMRLHAITTGTGDFIANGLVAHNCRAPRPDPPRARGRRGA